MPDLLETMLRGGAGTTFLLLAVILLRDGRDRTLARLGALFCVSTAWWALHLQPWIAWSHTWAFPLWVLSYAKTAAFWLFARALFEDGFRMRSAGVGRLGGNGGAGRRLARRLELGHAPHRSRCFLQVATVALAASAAWIAWKGRGADLVEPRRARGSPSTCSAGVLTIAVR
jgi:hypothetical protein